MKELTVAFIDDGVYKDGEIPLSCPVAENYIVVDDAFIREEIPSSLSISNHGTICYWIFASMVGQGNYHVISLKILDVETSKCRASDLCLALEWCYEHEVDMICMSIGTIHYQDFVPLSNHLLKLYKKGAIMVAACSNKNTYCYPASSEYVIGVRYLPELSYSQYCYFEYDPISIEIGCHCTYSELESVINEKIGAFSSFSAPYIAGIIFRKMIGGSITLEQVKRFLMEKASTHKKLIFNEYKKMLPCWENDVKIPIVWYITHEKERLTVNRLCECFHENGYYAVQVVKEREGNEFYKFQLEYLLNIGKELFSSIQLLQNLTSPDILFMELDEVEASLLSKKMEIHRIFFGDESAEYMETSLALNSENGVENMMNFLINYFNQ